MSTVQGGQGNIVTSGLILNLDAANPRSYPPAYNGTTWFNLASGSFNGTLTNGPTYNTGSGGSIVFDGVDDYVDNSFASPFAETIIVWAKSATTTWNTYGWISSSRKQNGHIIHPESSEFGGKRVTFYIYNSTVTPTAIGNISPSIITIPHMYCLSTNGSNSHKCYLDGTIIAENTTSITRTTTPSAQTWYLGRDDFGSRYGNGNIYNVIRYNRQLSDAEVNQNFQATRARFGI